MYLLYCDESNLDERAGDFFVYGGCIVEATQAYALSKSIDAIREKKKLTNDFLLKFNPKPDHITHHEFIELKQLIIKAAIDAKCIFMTSLILHDIAKSPDEARRNGINTICFHFECYLNRPKDHGLVLIDRFEDGKIDAHLREKFSTGLVGLPYSNKFRLERIIGFHYSAIGQSHLGSVVDIVLGSFRFAVNAFTRKDEKAIGSARAILQQIAPLFFREASEDRVSEISLFFSPKAVKSDNYRAAYEGLSGFFTENGIVPAQKITNVAHY